MGSTPPIAPVGLPPNPGPLKPVPPGGGPQPADDGDG